MISLKDSVVEGFAVSMGDLADSCSLCLVASTLGLVVGDLVSILVQMIPFAIHVVRRTL